AHPADQRGVAMPIPQQRDPDVTRSRLREWLATKVPGATDVWVSDVAGPAATGYSNETILFDAGWTVGGEKHSEGMVVRVKPAQYSIFLEAEFETQYKVMAALGTRTD